MRFSIFAILLPILASSCALAPQLPSDDIQPTTAVLAAADHPIAGVFRLQVRGSGRRDGRVYLNSESDYRDQRCLTVAIPDDVAAKLGAKFGGDVAVVLKGKTIRVRGEAKRVTIRLFEHDGTPMKEYYFQTHVRVEDVDQIEVL